MIQGDWVAAGECFSDSGAEMAQTTGNEASHDWEWNRDNDSDWFLLGFSVVAPVHTADSN